MPVFERLPTAFPRSVAFAVGAVLGLAVTAGVVAFLAAGHRSGGHDAVGDFRPAWVEVKWLLPADVWSAGKAFKCETADCGGEVTLYLRAKIGFCNCTTGVGDDEELERLADMHLVGGKHAADGPGRPIAVAWMKGRSRSYSVAGALPDGKSALIIAFNDRCDAIVGTLLSATIGQPPWSKL